MMEREERRAVRGASGELCRGRIPFAAAELEGCESFPSVGGRIAFFATPAGVVISAELWGLPRNRGGVLGFCLEERDRTPCSCLPLLYERGGEAWCTYLTGKLSPYGLSGRPIRLALWEGDCCREGRTVARGVIANRLRERYSS